MNFPAKRPDALLMSDKVLQGLAKQLYAVSDSEWVQRLPELKYRFRDGEVGPGRRWYATQEEACLSSTSGTLARCGFHRVVLSFVGSQDSTMSQNGGCHAGGGTPRRASAPVRDHPKLTESHLRRPVK